MATVSYSRWHVFSRICAGVLGSYVFTWGFAALGVSSLIAVGVEFHEASSLVAMLGFLVFLSTFCWAFIGNLTRVWIVLAGGGAVMTLAGWWLTRVIT